MPAEIDVSRKFTASCQRGTYPAELKFSYDGYQAIFLLCNKNTVIETIMLFNADVRLTIDHAETLVSFIEGRCANNIDYLSILDRASVRQTFIKSWRAAVIIVRHTQVNPRSGRLSALQELLDQDLEDFEGVIPFVSHQT